MKSFIKKRTKILVTGGAGYIGSHTCKLLKINGFEPIVFDNFSSGKKKFIKWGKYFKGDTKKIKDLDKAIKKFKPKAVIHFAANISVAESKLYPKKYYENNLFGTINLLNSIKKQKKKCICVIITSDKCYKNLEKIKGYKESDMLGGVDPYSASKAATEIAFQSYFQSFLKNTNHRFVTARAGNVIGGGDWSSYRIIPDCVRSQSKGKKVKIRNLRATRPWQHVIEILNGYLNLAKKLSLNKKINGQSFNFGPKNSEIVSVKQILVYIKNYWPTFGWVKTNNKIINETKVLVLDTSKAKKVLKWKTRLKVKDALKLTIEWYRSFYEKKLRKNSIEDLTDNQILNYHKKFHI